VLRLAQYLLRTGRWPSVETLLEDFVMALILVWRYKAEWKQGECATSGELIKDSDITWPAQYKTSHA
jgi:hypothetical protein